MMKNAIVYLCYKLDKSNNHSGNAMIAIQLCALFLLHVMPLVWIADALFYTHFFDAFVDLVHNDNASIRRFLLIPLAIAPVYVLIFVCLRRYSAMLADGSRKIEALPAKNILKMNIRYYTHLTGSYVFFVLGLVSPSWISWMKSL